MYRFALEGFKFKHHQLIVMETFRAAAIHGCGWATHLLKSLQPPPHSSISKRLIENCLSMFVTFGYSATCCCFHHICLVNTTYPT